MSLRVGASLSRSKPHKLRPAGRDHSGEHLHQTLLKNYSARPRRLRAQKGRGGELPHLRPRRQSNRQSRRYQQPPRQVSHLYLRRQSLLPRHKPRSSQRARRTHPSFLSHHPPPRQRCFRCHALSPQSTMTPRADSAAAPGSNNLMTPPRNRLAPAVARSLAVAPAHSDCARAAKSCLPCSCCL